MRMSGATCAGYRAHWVVGAVLCAVSSGCSGEDTRQLEPAALAMPGSTQAFYDDGDITLFQVQRDVPLPLKRPTDADRKNLGKAVKPFPRAPWVKHDQVRVQVTWTLANLDTVDHSVEILVDPWNEFGKYVPGVTVEGDNSQPNLSGIDETYDLPGLDSGRPSRISQVFSYDMMDELATDFATAMNIIENGPMAMDAEEEDPRVGYVNHVFALPNRSGEDPLTDRYIPEAIPGLVGFTFGVRTQEKVGTPDKDAPDDDTKRKGGIAVEFAVELIDENGDRVLDEDSHDPALSAPDTVITLGNG
jgi:hypothetical protein